MDDVNARWVIINDSLRIRKQPTSKWKNQTSRILLMHSEMCTTHRRNRPLPRPSRDNIERRTSWSMTTSAAMNAVLLCWVHSRDPILIEDKTWLAPYIPIVHSLVSGSSAQFHRLQQQQLWCLTSKHTGLAQEFMLQLTHPLRSIPFPTPSWRSHTMMKKQ